MLVLALLSPDTRAQNGSMRVTVPSPTAASLGKFGDVPVSLYTGTPEISVPLFTAKGRTLELPIALKYHAGGIRVEEIGSWLGLGWTLEAGGAITRTVRGLVDESASGYFNTGHHFWTQGNWPNPPPELLRQIRDGYVDGDPDQFFFSFAGRSGQFVMGHTSASVREFRPIPYQKLRIEPSPSFEQWVITTEDGTKYTFSARETSTDWSTLSPATELGSHVGETHTSTWHLSEIRSPGGDVITLYYSPYSATHRQGSYLERFTNVVTNPPGGEACVPSSTSATNEYNMGLQRLDSIKTAAHTVKFSAATLRLDARSPTGAQQEPRLDRITVTTPTGAVLRVFRFDHDYFPGNRLRLNNVFEEDRNGVALPPTSFTYDPQTLPPRTSFSQDHWGYYNGKSNSTLIPTIIGPGGVVYPGADRTPDPAFMRMASLTRITYPTGGYSEFVYEANDYGGVGASGTPPVTEGPEQQQSALSQMGDGPVSETFTVGGTRPTNVTVEVSQSPSGCMPSDWDPCPYTELVGYGVWRDNRILSVTLAPGTYTITASDEFNPSGIARIIVTWRDQGVDGATSAGKTGGGLRVAEIRTADAMGNVTVRKYRYRLQSDTARSSGVVSLEPRYAYQFNSSACSYFARGSVSKLPLGDGPPVGYREVTVWHGASGEYGKTRHGFRSVLDAADPAPSGSWLLAPRTSYEWKRGQEREVTERNAAGQIQQSVASTFAFRDEDGEPQTTREFRGMSVHYVAGSCDLCTSVYAYSDFKVISAWTYQDTDTSVVYDTTGTSSFSTVRTYVHGNPTHGQLTEVTETNSDGSQRITRSKYPADFATGSGNDEAIALTAMQGVAHIHSPVIERWVTQRVDGTDSVVQAEAMTFKTFAPGQYLPYQRFVLSSAAAVTNFVPSSVSAGAFTKDSRYLLQESANGYDGYGRITQVGDARGKLTNYEHGGNPNNAFLTKVTRVKDSGGVTDLVTDLAYDSLGFLQSIKDEGGSFRYFTYDLFGRLRHIKNHGGTVLKAFGYVYSRTSPTWTFNSASPNAVVDTTFLQLTPLKSVVSTQFLDGLGRVIQTVVQDGASFVVTASQYDAMGRPWRAWKPYTRTTAGYDASFATNVTSFYNSYHAASDAKPYVETQYRPDALDRVSKVIPEYIGASPAAVTRHSYGIDPAAKQMIVEVADALDKKTRSFSDVFGNQVKTIRGFGAPEATTTLFASNIVGQRVKATDPRGLNTTYTLDTRGLITAKTSPDAGTVLYKHDKNGNLRYTQDANDVAFGHVNFTNYDFANRPLISGEGPWSFGSLDPDAEPLPALETNTNAWLVVRAYDAKPSTAAFPWSFFSPEISPLTLTNVSGRLAAVASKSNGAWQATMFSYDADGRVATRHTFTQGNGGGPVLAAVNTQVNYVRDLRDAVTERWLTVGASTFNQWYDYDNRGLLWKVFASTGSGKPATPDVTFTYRPSGQVQDRQFQGGPLIPMRYTIHEQLEKIGDPVVTTYPFSARYAYHANGTVSESEFYSAGSPATQKRYKYVFGLSAYDVIDRLKSADFSGWNGSSWTSTLAHDLANIAYDPSGNLTALQRYRETETLIDNLTYTYPRSSNQLSSVSDAVGSTVENWDAETGSFTYDANGNLLTAPAPYAITAVTYDHRNLPLSLTGNGVTSSYRYDDGGQRITKQVAGRNTEVYVLNGTSILGVITVNGSGTPVSWYFNVLAGDRVIGRQPSVGNRKYYHTDLLGSTRAVVEGTAIVESYDPEPWGLHMPGRTLGTGTKELFTGKERDAESALDYFGARLYMPAVARWSSVDPLADRAPAWSSYAYVFNNPLSAIDPTGRQTIVLKGADAQEFFDDLKKDQQRRQRGARRSQEPSATTGDAASRGVAEVFPCGRSFLGSCEERAALRTEAIKVLLEASKQALKDLLASAFGEMDCGEGVYCGAPPLVGPIGGGRHAGNLIRGVDHGAPSSANAARLRNALTLREAASVFTKSGGLHADVIRNSTRIIDGTALRNPDVVRQLTKDGSNIADWGKYVSDWYKSPAGEFQVHYYYNRATGVVNTTIDYKAVFK
jgi:RHS repeat-associated protein